MSTNYQLRESEREALIQWVDRALDMDPPLSSICIDRKVGRSISQQGELQSEELAILSSANGAAGVVEEIVSRWGRHGGRWQLRLMIDVGDGEPKKQLKRSFDLVRVSPTRQSKASGSAQGVEELTRSFADAFAAQISAQQDAQNASQSALMAMLERSDQHALIRLQESTSYQSTIDGLRQENMRLSLEVALSQQQSAITPEMLQQVLPPLVQLIGAAATKLLGSSAAPAAVVQPIPAGEA